MDTGRRWSNIPDPYTTLQVSPNAEQEVIEAAYRRLARKYHPDVNPTPEAAEKMRDLNIAYEILSNPFQRRLYDQWKEAHTAESIYTDDATGEAVPSPGASRRGWWFCLRWVLILPVGIIAVLITTFLLNTFIDLAKVLLRPEEEGTVSLSLFALPTRTLKNLSQAFCNPLAFIWFGSLMAPGRRTIVAGSLLILWTLFLGAGAMGGARNYSGWRWAEFAGALLLGITAAIYGFYLIYRREREKARA